MGYQPMFSCLEFQRHGLVAHATASATVLLNLLQEKFSRGLF